MMAAMRGFMPAVERRREHGEEVGDRSESSAEAGEEADDFRALERGLQEARGVTRDEVVAGAEDQEARDGEAARGCLCGGHSARMSAASRRVYKFDYPRRLTSMRSYAARSSAEAVGCDWLGRAGGAVLSAQLDTAPEAVDELNALRAVAEVLLQLATGGGREVAVEVLGEHREDPAAIPIVHEDDSLERR